MGTTKPYVINRQISRHIEISCMYAPFKKENKKLRGKQKRSEHSYCNSQYINKQELISIKQKGIIFSTKEKITPPLRLAEQEII